MQAKTSKGNVGPRFRIFLPILVSVLAAAIWCASWWGIARTTEFQLDEWLQQEHALGRQWACSQREINGFPFRIALTCDAPNLVGEVNGEPVEAGFHALRAVVELYRPNHIIVEADPPLIGRDLRGGDLRLDWAGLQASFVGGATSLQRLSLTFDQFTVRVTPALLGESEARAARAQLDISPTADLPAASKSYDLAVRLDDAVIAGLDAWVGSNSPLNMTLVGTLGQAELGSEGTAAERLERWRRAGGKFDVGRLILDKGSVHIVAHGQIHLDDLHRPSGQLEAELDGIEPIMARLGVPPAAIRLGNLGSLLSGAIDQKKVASEAAERMRLKLTFDKGRVMVGPFPTIILRPLY